MQCSRIDICPSCFVYDLSNMIFCPIGSALTKHSVASQIWTHNNNVRFTNINFLKFVKRNHCISIFKETYLLMLNYLWRLMKIYITNGTPSITYKSSELLVQVGFFDWNLSVICHHHCHHHRHWNLSFSRTKAQGMVSGEGNSSLKFVIMKRGHIPFQGEINKK